MLSPSPLAFLAFYFPFCVVAFLRNFYFLFFSF
nr:MAG TPA: hypothetical protein [Bacteriophage sp.]DAT56807.1 MAG TPA: hypothetical protein [Bacteriophage sp.]